MQFVPLWTSILNSRKVAGLPDDLYRMWTLCLVVAQEYDHRYGTLPAPDDLSYRLHLDPKECMSRLSRLSRDGFIEIQDGVYSIHDWEDWKHRPDPTSAARKRAQRQREREKKQEVTSESDDTDPSIDVTVTAVTSQMSQCHAPTNLTLPDLKTHPPTPRDAPLDADADRVCHLAAELGGDISWALWCSRRIQMGDSPAVMEAALKAAVDAGIVNQQYVGKIATRYARDGIPSSNGKPRPGSGEVAYKPSPTPGYMPPQPRSAGPKIPAAEALRILKGESA